MTRRSVDRGLTIVLWSEFLHNEGVTRVYASGDNGVRETNGRKRNKVRCHLFVVITNRLMA